MDLFLTNWNSGNFTNEERAELIHGFTSLKSTIVSNNSASLIELPAVFSQLYIYAIQSDLNKKELMNWIDSFVDENKTIHFPETLSNIFQELWKDIQYNRLAELFTNINSKLSQTHSHNISDFISSLNDERLSSLYSNKSDKLNIDFEVEVLPFPLEILDPRIVKIPAGKSNELHKHAHETVFVFLKGAGHVKIDDLKIPIKEGDFVFIPRWCMHQSVNESSEQMVFLAIADFGLTGKSFVGNYLKTARLNLPE